MARPVRQWTATLTHVAADHLERYRFAADTLRGAWESPRVLDAGCGCGYGSAVLAEAGCDVLGIDIDEASIAFAREHYGSARFEVRDVCDAVGEFDAVVSIETLEHVADAPRAVAAFRTCAPVLVASVPNEVAIPWATHPKRHPDHVRHYTPGEFDELLEGYHIVGRFTQRDKMPGHVAAGFDGRTLIVIAERTE
jgi:SAM-dependent methyltransferase